VVHQVEAPQQLLVALSRSQLVAMAVDQFEFLPVSPDS
jgi:hypothetical protein